MRHRRPLRLASQWSDREVLTIDAGRSSRRCASSTDHPPICSPADLPASARLAADEHRRRLNGHDFWNRTNRLVAMLARAWRRVLLVGASTAVALLLAELSTRCWLAPDVHWFQPVFLADPEVGYTLRPGHHGVVLGADLRVNSRGFRGGEWPEVKPEGHLRVAVIGDSHAFGYGVGESEALPARLAAHLADRRASPVETLNFAVPGYTARQELAALETKALPLAPDAVAVVLCDNDERADLWVDDGGWLRGDAPGSGPERPGRVHGPFLPSTRLGLLRHSRLLGYLMLQRRRLAMQATPPAPGWDRPLSAAPFPDLLRREVYEPVQRMIALCRARHIAVVVALFGSDPGYRRLLATLARDERVATVDLNTLFPEAASWDDLGLRFGLGWDPHLGPEAHARWGRALADALALELGRAR